MQHRHGSRIDLALTVDIKVGALPARRCQTRNISRDGMFLDTGRIDLCPDDFFGLTIHLDRGPRKLTAVVIHHSADGIGVMLATEDPVYVRFVQKAIESSRSLQSAPVDPDASNPPQLQDERGVLVLRIGERLDFSVAQSVQRAMRFIAAATVERIVVDLAATRRVFDSGLGLLLLLLEHADRLDYPICLANCAPEVKGRLSAQGFASRFQLT